MSILKLHIHRSSAFGRTFQATPTRVSIDHMSLSLATTVDDHMDSGGTVVVMRAATPGKLKLILVGSGRYYNIPKKNWSYITDQLS